MLEGTIEIRCGDRRPPNFSGAPRGRPIRQERYAEAGIEPTLEDLLNDPVTLALIQCDKVNVACLRALLQETRHSLLSREA